MAPISLASPLKSSVLLPKTRSLKLPPSKLLMLKIELINSPLMSFADISNFLSDFMSEKLPRAGLASNLTVPPALWPLYASRFRVALKSFKIRFEPLASNSMSPSFSLKFSPPLSARSSSFIKSSVLPPAILKFSPPLLLLPVAPFAFTPIAKLSAPYGEPSFLSSGVSNLTPLASMLRFSKSLVFIFTPPSDIFRLFSSGE